MTALIEQMHRACAELRFAEGLRRRSAEARAESTIREACALATLEGSRVPPSQLRELLMTFPGGVHGALGKLDPASLQADLTVTLGAWRATWAVVSRLLELNAGVPNTKGGLPLRAFLAGMQRDYCSAQVAKGMISSDQVAIPVDPAAWAVTLARIESTEGSALDRAAQAWALLALDPPFVRGSQAMGVLLAKKILADEGVEPTAVSVLSLSMIQDTAAYRVALAGAFGQGHQDWVEYVAKSVIRGCEAGQAIVKEVQAARLR